MCIKCWCVMMKSSNHDCLSSIHSLLPQFWIPNSPSSDQNLYKPRILQLEPFVLNPHLIWLKSPQNSEISVKISTSAAAFSRSGKLIPKCSLILILTYWIGLSIKESLTCNPSIITFILTSLSSVLRLLMWGDTSHSLFIHSSSLP